MASFCSWRAISPLRHYGRLGQLQTVLKRSAAIAAAKNSTVFSDEVTKTSGVASEPSPATAFHRTSECNPVRHSDEHEGMFYTITSDDINRYFRKSFRLEYYNQCKAFLENALMVRKPAIEVMTFLRAASYADPAVRYVMYGETGSGKTSTLVHVVHFAAKDGWLVVYLPWPAYWNSYFKETSASSFKAGRIDTPQEAVEILSDFKRINKDILERHELKTVHRYVWSRREVFEAGTPWTRLLEFGIERQKFSSDLVGALLKEIRAQSSQLPFRTLVAVDGANSLWGSTRLKNEDHTPARLDQLTLVHNFRKLLRGTWSNGAMLLTVDKCAAPPALQDSHLPSYLLQKQGFEWLDPFVPVEVSGYSLKEVHSCIDYYIDRNWIRLPETRTEESRKELIFLSGHNPLELNKLCTLR